MLLGVSEIGCVTVGLSFHTLQGTQPKDIKIPPDAPKDLLLEKHAHFIEQYGKKKDDYV